MTIRHARSAGSGAEDRGCWYPCATGRRRVAVAPEFRAHVANALATHFPEDPDAPTPPVEKQIFGGFYGYADKALLAEFQRVDRRRRQEIVSALSDARLRQLGHRLVAFLRAGVALARRARAV